MKYGTSVIILAILDVLVIFSGLPTSWKKIIILIISLLLIIIGWILRAIAERRKARVHAVVEKIEHDNVPIEQVAREIAHDVEIEVEQDLHHLTDESHE